MGMYDYGYDYGHYDQIESLAGGIAGFFLVFILFIYLLMIAYAITAYALGALGVYAVAKRRGIHHAWIAWIPIGDGWLLGSISDQYQYVAKGRVRNRRKVLLALQIAIVAICTVMLVAAFLLGLFSGAFGDGFAVGSLMGLVGLLYIALMVVMVIHTVFYYIALYDLYMSCEPGSAVLYLVLSILVSVTLPFFIFFNRKKDIGMPPRRTPHQLQTESAPDAPTPETPAQEVPAEETPVAEEPAEVEPAEEAPSDNEAENS